MQLISSYNPEDNARLQPALSRLCNPDDGLEARYLVTTTGWFARFVWPDRPQKLAGAVWNEVDEFHRVHPELRSVEKGSPEWQSVSRGWETDPESAQAIFECFDRHFPNKVRWVKSARDPRGQIGATCRVEGVGDFSVHLSWRSPSIQPLGILDDEYWNAFQESAREVLQWAGHRIQPILDDLKGRLQHLYGERFRGLYVFGSYARPDAGIELPEDSDLDVALLLSDFESPYKEIERFSEITADVSSQHGLVISLVPIRESDYKEGKTNFIRVISEYAIPV